MLFKDYLKLHGVGVEYLSPDGVLARINLGHGMFEPYQPKLRASLAKVPLFEVIQPGVFVKFLKNFCCRSTAILKEVSSGPDAYLYSLN